MSKTGIATAAFPFFAPWETLKQGQKAITGAMVKTPDLAPAPATPTEESPEIKQASEEASAKELELARKRKGRRSTILTGAQGVTDTPQLTAASLLAGKTRLGQ